MVPNPQFTPNASQYCAPNQFPLNPDQGCDIPYDQYPEYHNTNFPMYQNNPVPFNRTYPVPNTSTPAYENVSTRNAHFRIRPNIVDSDSDQDSTGARAKPARERIPVLKPDTYNGTGSWREYLKRFENCAESNRWTECTKAQQLKHSLRGNAAAIVHKNPLSVSWKYVELVNQLDKAYGPSSKHASVLRLELRNRKREKGEELYTLRDDIYDKVSSVYGDCSTQEQQYFAVEVFIQALSDTELIEKLLDKDPRTLADAYEIAHRYETTKNAAQSVAHCPQNSKRIRAVVESDEMIALRNQVAELSATVQVMSETIVSKVGERSHPVSERSQPVSERSKPWYEKSPRGDMAQQKPTDHTIRHRSKHIQCYTCHGWGHVSKECANNTQLPLN
jgi:hypothetical protein